MKINNISWQNYRGLADGSIQAGGNDVIITGQNGAGKSSLASLLPFILFGKGADTVKKFDNGLIPTDTGLIHAAEVTFDNGLTLRREVAWQGNGNRSALYINGNAVKNADFNLAVRDITNGGNNFVFNLFDFCQADWKIQRQFLLKNFGDDDGSIPEQFATVPDIIGRHSPDEFNRAAKVELKKLKADADKIPVQIETLNAQITNVNFETLADDINSVRNQRDSLTNIDELQRQFDSLNQQLQAALANRDFISDTIDKRETERKAKLNEYHQWRQTRSGTCPTCGQTLPAEKFSAKRNAELQRIVNDGKLIADELEKLQTRLNKLDIEIAKFKSQITELDGKIKASDPVKITDQRRVLDEKFSVLFHATDIKKQIERLADSAKTLGKQITALEFNISLVDAFIQFQIERSEQQINQQFAHVNFKLFDYKITSGELRQTCEPTLHGVPFSSLSKGERLKAALDVIATFQRHFAVELPLFIDDAESYTNNSFDSLPNTQLWLFKVTDEPELKISVTERSNAA